MSLTHEEIETVRIHINAFKEKLCNQRRWKDAEEYQKIVDKLDDILLADFVVRCKDCKWASSCYGDVVRASKGGGEVHRPLGTNGYCSLAERKEE